MVSRYMMKAIVVILPGVTSLYAVPYFPVAGITAARHEVVSCLADELSRWGYQLDTRGTPLPGTVWTYSVCEGKVCLPSGTFWVQTPVTGGPEKEVGFYGADRKGSVVFKAVMSECAKRFDGSR